MGETRIFRECPLEEATMVMSRYLGDRTLILSIEGMAGASLLVATLDYVRLVPAVRSSGAREAEAERLREYLRTLSRWAGQQRRASAPPG